MRSRGQKKRPLREQGPDTKTSTFVRYSMPQQKAACQLSDHEKYLLFEAEYRAMTALRKHLERELAEIIRRQQDAAQKLRVA